ncbi:hypothetical protein GCM10023168_26300 [Fodinibacter luteus]|uniref:Uncharacterized protein n=1 Tax=Fodinibacter luteus TaxID=552064 RepID=A0ABP8KK98_9MICO
MHNDPWMLCTDRGDLRRIPNDTVHLDAGAEEPTSEVPPILPGDSGHKGPGHRVPFSAGLSTCTG